MSEDDVADLIKQLEANYFVHVDGTSVRMTREPSQIELKDIFHAVSRDGQWLEGSSVAPRLAGLFDTINRRAQQALLRQIGSKCLADVLPDGDGTMSTDPLTSDMCNST
ncbi:hypothetical protein [Rhizobium sp. Rhizsp82]|uniref:hypothetical protein n=1 Tax=Rhizobium sp. Rhizsp82 TaxID=3243057 RepID=UPI0039B5EF4F